MFFPPIEMRDEREQHKQQQQLEEAKRPNPFREFNQNLYLARRKLKRYRQRKHKSSENGGIVAGYGIGVGSLPLPGDSFMQLNMAAAAALPPAVIRT